MIRQLVSRWVAPTKYLAVIWKISSKFFTDYQIPPGMNLNDSVVKVLCWSYLLQLLIFAIIAMHPANSFVEKEN